MADVDIVVVGAGHNGLVCGAYLAQAGYEVLVVEQRPDVGGCTRTIDFPGLDGWRVNTCADVDIFLHNGPVPQDLSLEKYGLTMLRREATFFVPFEDGRCLFFWPDIDRTAREIAQFSAHDAAAYRDYLKYWDEAYRRLGPLALQAPPPNRELVAALGDDVWAEEFVQLLATPGDVIAKSFFESPQMQGIMAWQISMYGVSPDQAGVGMGIAHLAGCMLEGIQRPRGGTGALCAAIQNCLEAHGGNVMTRSKVKQIRRQGERAVGVELEGGEVIHARRAVVASIDAKRVFLDLMDEEALTSDDRRAVERISINNIGLFRVSLAVSKPPLFNERYGSSDDFCTNSLQASQMLLADSWETVQSTWDIVSAGDIPKVANSMWIGIPTAMDDTLVPPGCHLVSFAEYLPYQLREGNWKDRAAEAAEVVVDTWCRYSSSTRDNIVGMWVQTPEDIARETGNINSNAFHIDEALHQMFGMRPTPRMSNYRTPVEGLYLSGSGVHPGGGITGLPGRNTALAVLADLAETEPAGRPVASGVTKENE